VNPRGPQFPGVAEFQNGGNDNAALVTGEIRAYPFAMNLPRFCFLVVAVLVLGFTGKTFASDTSGQEEERGVAGIGAYIDSDVKGSPDIHEYIVVTRVLDHSPAKKAGIKAGDEIVEIDGMKVAGMNLHDVVHNHLRGPLGSVVQVTIIHPVDQSRHKYDLKRDVTPEEKKQSGQ
jgi:S1-C subfamily serine protease